LKVEKDSGHDAIVHDPVAQSAQASTYVHDPDHEPTGASRQYVAIQSVDSAPTTPDQDTWTLAGDDVRLVGVAWPP
jgi:hypothetical protein